MHLEFRSLTAGIPKILHGVFKLWTHLQIKRVSDMFLCSPYHFGASRKDLWLDGPLVLSSNGIYFLKALWDVTETPGSQYSVIHVYENLYFAKHIHVYLSPGFICLHWVVSFLLFSIQIVNSVGRGSGSYFCIPHWKHWIIEIFLLLFFNWVFLCAHLLGGGNRSQKWVDFRISIRNMAVATQP